VKRAR